MANFEHRFYRDRMGEGRFSSFVLQYKDSDLWIGIDVASFTHEIPWHAKQYLVQLRDELEQFIVQYPDFSSSFLPVSIPPDAPIIAHRMALAAQKAGTGPMAAVAGAFSEFVGKELMQQFCLQEVVVENGGDIFLVLKDKMVLSVYAGNSPLSGKMGIEITAADTPLGVCTSAGTVGPSVSFGNADAVMVACSDTALADAYATSLGNKVKSFGDIEPVLIESENATDIQSLFILCEGKIGIRGRFPMRWINV